ncbi:MAG: hypothetical protein IJX80_08745 [Clostridia bacterium]|nr:hypothetical protein [Clostridia bacterium]
MKKIVLRIISAICMVLLCFSMASCSSYKVETGYFYLGKLPSMFLGIRTNQTEYSLDDVSLEIAYGWPEGYLDYSSHEGYENYSVLIVAYDWTMLGTLPYGEPTENYDAYFSTDNLCVLKEIKDDFSNDKYVVTKSGSFGAKIEYNTKENFHIPEELFENLTSSRSSIYFEIVLIGYSESDNTYLATYTDEITVNFEVDDNNTVKIID